AFLVFGVPRLERRRRRERELFGDEDERDSDELRRVARTAAAAGDWAEATAELFRAIARRLAERTIVASFPGTTAHGVAGQAAGVFPDAASRLADAADDFDAVRYLGSPGSEEGYRRMEALERELHDATPSRGGTPVDGAWAVVS